MSLRPLILILGILLLPGGFARAEAVVERPVVMKSGETLHMDFP